MEKDDAIKEMKYEIGKYIFSLLEEGNLITHQQFLDLRDELIDIYNPIIGELEKGLDYEDS
ncbi:MAG: hypothetical protein J5968_01995 [Oscillospiraceae bacterium]|nr:hypothetical protein [Oscillospiraceae bacterium]